MATCCGDALELNANKILGSEDCLTDPCGRSFAICSSAVGPADSPEKPNDNTDLHVHRM